MMLRVPHLLVLSVFAPIVGCATIRTTDPPRTATEQFLVNEAARRSIGQLSAEALRDRLVFVDSSYMISSRYPLEEQVFAVAELRSHLLEAGARLTNDRDAAAAIVEIRAVGIGIDRLESLLGIPSLVIQQGNATQAPIATPELALYKKTRQRGYASIAYVAWWRDTGELLTTSGPHVSRTFREDIWILGWGPRTVGNVPPAED
jgi:hypothetical protein